MPPTLAPLERTHWLVLLAILVVAIALRVNGISELELWHDEAGSMLAANGLSYVGNVPDQGFTPADLVSYNTVPNAIAACLFIDSGNGSLYTVLLHGWSLLFGNEPVALRALSLIITLFTAIVAFMLCRRLFRDPLAALITLAFMATSRMFIGQGLQVRPYALAVLLSFVATALLFRMLLAGRPKPGTVVLYGLITVAALLSHYSTCYIFLAHPIVAVIMRASPRNILRIALGGMLALGLFILWMKLAGYEGMEQMRISNQSYVDRVKADPDIISFFAATKLRTIIEGWVVQLLWATGNGLQYLGPQLRVITLLLVIPFALVTIAIVRTQDAQERRVLYSLCVLLFSSMAYATVLALITGHTVSFQGHYAMFSTPYAALLLGRALSLVPSTTGRLRPMAIANGAALVVVMAVSLMIMGRTSITAPNSYGLYADRMRAALERYSDDEVVAIHSSRNAAYMNALYAPTEAHQLRNYIDTTYEGISGLIVRSDEGSWSLPIRAVNPEFPRSEPRDGDLWELDLGGPAPAIPDSVDAWVPDQLPSKPPSATSDGH